MSEKNFDFFQDHSRHYLEMALRTDRLEIMKNPDGYGKRTGECGDTVEVFVRVEGRGSYFSIAASTTIYRFTSGH